MAFSMMSIGGLASGLDTESIISGLMQAERTPVTRFQQRQAELRKVDDAWGTVTTKLSAVRSAVDKLKAVGAFDAYAAVSSSNADAVAATKTGTPSTGSLSFSVDALATAHQAAFTGVYASAGDLVGAGSFTVNQGAASYAVTTSATTTLSQLAAELNANLPGLTASVVAADGGSRLVLGARQTGSANAITLSNTAGAPAGLGSLSQMRAADDAKLTLGGGITVTRSGNTVTDVLVGVSLDLKQADPAKTVTVTTTRDTDAAKTAVQGLVDAVNGVLTSLKDLTKYDVASKTAGVLQGDDTARRLMMDLRQALSVPVAGLSGTYTAASSVGLTLTNDGLTKLDTTKLQKAFNSDYAAVGRLFSDSAGADGITGALGGVLTWAEGDKLATDPAVARGAIGRARDSISGEGGEIKRLDRRIADFELRLNSREVTLRKKFAGLETALANTQSQGNWLSGMFGQSG
jgi:flagellar hook-associated protein 2